MADRPALRAWFRCASGCEFEAELFEVVYRCARCNGLLEVAHDVAALARTSADEWKARFDARYRAPTLPDGSGVWGKKEWVYPQLPAERIISLGEGASPLLPAGRYGEALGLPHLHLKQCGTSHTGSFKDLGMTVLVSAVREMRARGKAIRAVACASTGDTSAALAAYCAAAGIPSVVLLPRGKVSTAQLVQPIANGALVLALDTDFDGCMHLIEQLATDPAIYLANSMNSLRLEGQKTLAIEVTEQLGWEPPDWIVVPGGNLGNSSAIASGFLMMKALGLISRLPRLAVAQSANAAPLHRAFEATAGFKKSTEVRSLAAKATLATAIQIGAPVSSPRAVRALQALDGVVTAATESELANAAARADQSGFFADPHTGVALAAVEQLAAKQIIKKEHRVVVVSTAHGLKFTDMKVRYHEATLLEVEPALRNPAVSIPAELGAVHDAIARRFGPK